MYARDRVLMERFARIAEQRYGVGEVSQADALRAQVELTRLANRTSTQALAIESETAALNALLSRDPTRRSACPRTRRCRGSTGRPDALIELALAQRPELAAQAPPSRGTRPAFGSRSATACPTSRSPAPASSTTAAATASAPWCR